MRSTSSGMEIRSATCSFEALWQAAERGCACACCSTTYNTRGLDATIAALDAHPNIEVRLYNPFVQRRRAARSISMTDFTRLNRRMHNKSFTADNQVSVVGGRNIGNEYFGAGSGVRLRRPRRDRRGRGGARGVEGVRSLLEQSVRVSGSDSSWAWPRPQAAHNLARDVWCDAAPTPNRLPIFRRVRETPIVRNMLDHRLEFEWVTARASLYDDPAKTLDTNADTDDSVVPGSRARDGSGRASRSTSSRRISFLGKVGTASVGALAARGVKVRILTNSLSSTDVKAVHAGYAKRREKLL